MSDGVMRFRVLVVEDEPLIGMEIEYAVEGLGHVVVGPVAELSGALDLAADETLGGAILDVNIRGGNSYPVADMLLKRGVPVLFLSGYGMHTLPERLHEEAPTEALHDRATGSGNWQFMRQSIEFERFEMRWAEAV